MNVLSSTSLAGFRRAFLALSLLLAGGPSSAWGQPQGGPLPPAPDPSAADVVLFHHVDPLGSVRALTDAAGQVVSRHDYLPFGEEIPCDVGGRDQVGGYCDAQAGPSLRFSGTPHDRESGLNYFGARYLSGAQGRFVSADTPLVGQHAEDPQSWNLYPYTGNSPLTRIDPDGRDWFWRDGAAPVWVDCTGDKACDVLESLLGDGGWQRFMPTRPDHVLRVDYMDGFLRIGVDKDGNPRMSYQADVGLEPVPGPVEFAAGFATKFLTRAPVPSFRSGPAGEEYVRTLTGGTKTWFRKIPMKIRPDRGVRPDREVDSFARGVLHESKVGWVAYDSRVAWQILKDRAIIREGLKGARSAHWHFLKNAEGVIGADPRVLRLLERFGIKYTIGK